MTLKIGELLVKEGTITRKQLDEALKCQVIFGGRLGTNLVEMGYLEEQKLVDCLSRQLSVPFVSPEQMMSVPPEVIKLISKELAEEYKFIPLSLDKKKLTVAIWDPSDLSAIDAISFITGYIIKPLVCSELRLQLALEQYYGVKRQVRYIQLSGGTGSRSRKETEDTAAEGSADVDAFENSPFKDLMAELPPAPPPDATDDQASWGDIPGLQMKERVPAALPERSQVAPPQVSLPVEEPEVLPLLEPIRETMPAPPPPPIAVPPPAAPVPPEHTQPGNLLAALVEAGDKDAIAEALVGFLGREFARVALFMVKGRVATGWRGVLNSAPINGFGHFQVPLDEPTLLKLVVDTKNFYLGPVLDTPGNVQIITRLGGGTPDTVLLIPIIMMERVVTVFYVDGDKTLLGKKLFELQKIIGKASLAFEILILKNKIMLA